MKSIKIIFLCVIAISLAACGKQYGVLNSAPESSVNSGLKANTASVKRFQETDSEGPTAIESAIELSKKYAALSDEMTKLKMEKQHLENQKDQLDERFTALQEELIQTKKELTEANDLLVEMRIELNNWKSDILGFRDEMRQADKVQLEALAKILKVLGGEVDDTAEAVSQPQEQTQ